MFALQLLMCYFWIFYRAHMQDFQEVTQEILYENYRSERIASNSTATKKIKYTLGSWAYSNRSSSLLLDKYNSINIISAVFLTIEIERNVKKR